MSSSGVPDPRDVIGSSAQTQVGRMTAVMRAMTGPDVPKVLRVAVLIGGRIVDERIVRQRKSVTVGTSKHATFRMTGANAPTLFKLFEFAGGNYVVNFVDGMSGRLALSTGLAELESLKAYVAREGKIYKVNLVDDVRGRITIGDVSFLFQFVPKPTLLHRTKLAPAFKNSLASGIDWDLTMLAAFSFLLHFGTIGVSARWDPEVSDDVTVGMIEMANGAVPPAQVEAKVQDPRREVASDVPTDESHPSTSSPAQPNKTVTRSQGRDSALKVTSDPKDASGLAGEAERLFGGKISALTAGKATDEALSGKGAPIDLNDVANGNKGIEARSNNGLNLGGATGPLVPNGGRGGLSDLAIPSTGSPDIHVKPPPPGRLPIEVTPSPQPPPTVCPTADVTIRNFAPRARACYQTTVNTDAAEAGQGRIALSMKIGANGEVTGVSSSNSGVSKKVEQCIRNAASGLRFGCKPGDAGGVVTTAFNFVLRPTP